MAMSPSLQTTPDMEHEFYITETLLVVGPMSGNASHGFFVAVGPSEKKWLIGVEHAGLIGAGTFTVQRKTRGMADFADLPGWSAIPTSPVPTLNILGPIGLYDGDRFRVVFAADGTIDGWDGAFRLRCVLHDGAHNE